MNALKYNFDLLSLLNKKIPYLFTLRNVLVISLFLGSVQVFLTIFLEPHGTGEYQASFRNLRLAGFILCFIFPFLMIYGVEHRIVKLQRNVWRVYQEIVSKFLLVVLISTASYFYNITIINSISPSWEGWNNHMLVFAWPYIPIFIPFMVIIYLILLRYYSEEEKKLIIKGKNQDDLLEIAESQFIYAESDQNYVSIYFKKDEDIDKQLMRSPLQDIEDQIENSVRVHRSYLINPNHVISVEGNKRKKVAILDGIESPIPVSANFAEDTLI
jgi:hypothetical protein